MIYTINRVSTKREETQLVLDLGLNTHSYKSLLRRPKVTEHHKYVLQVMSPHTHYSLREAKTTAPHMLCIVVVCEPTSQGGRCAVEVHGAT